MIVDYQKLFLSNQYNNIILCCLERIFYNICQEIISFFFSKAILKNSLGVEYSFNCQMFKYQTVNWKFCIVAESGVSLTHDLFSVCLCLHYLNLIILLFVYFNFRLHLEYTII